MFYHTVVPFVDVRLHTLRSYTPYTDFVVLLPLFPTLHVATLHLPYTIHTHTLLHLHTFDYDVTFPYAMLRTICDLRSPTVICALLLFYSTHCLLTDFTRYIHTYLPAIAISCCGFTVPAVVAGFVALPTLRYVPVTVPLYVVSDLR